MLPININVNEENDDMCCQSVIECETTDDFHIDDMCRQCCCVCETTAEHDACVAKMIKLSSRGFNTMSAVFDKSTNTLTHKSYDHLEPHEIRQQATQFRDILMTHTDNATNYRIV